MAIAALKKAKTWLKTNHYHDILTWCRLVDLAIARHIQNNMPLLIALTENWDLNCNTFHLPLGEMTFSLLDSFRIWGIPIKGRLVHQMEVLDNNMRE